MFVYFIFNNNVTNSIVPNVCHNGAIINIHVVQDFLGLGVEWGRGEGELKVLDGCPKWKKRKIKKGD